MRNKNLFALFSVWVLVTLACNYPGVGRQEEQTNISGDALRETLAAQITAQAVGTPITTPFPPSPSQTAGAGDPLETPGDPPVETPSAAD